MPVSSASWLHDREVIHRNESNGGLLVRLDGREVAKVFPRKGFLLGWMRVLLGKTKAHKQYQSMKALEREGILTPKPLRVVSFRPGVDEFEGALVYEYAEDVEEMRDALKGEMRSRLLDRLADDLIAMAKGGILFVDFHLGNILVNEAGTLCWIDVEVREGHGLVETQFWSRVERMHRKCDPGVLSDEEWKRLCQRLASALSGFKGEPSYSA